MFSRVYREFIQHRLKVYPAVVVGPRQCGKTTLAQSLPKTSSFNLEKEADRLRLDVSWPQLSAGHTCLVLDEAQNMSDLFPRLRVAIDADRKRTGRFLLGSVAPSLMKQVTESLAVRLSVCEMTPLLATELPQKSGIVSGGTAVCCMRCWVCRRAGNF